MEAGAGLERAGEKFLATYDEERLENAKHLLKTTADEAAVDRATTATASGASLPTA
jgi:transcriptional regulator GlxA family with amidase domain